MITILLDLFFMLVFAFSLYGASVSRKFENAKPADGTSAIAGFVGIILA
jgi:hypothetical protein